MNPIELNFIIIVGFLVVVMLVNILMTYLYD